MKARIPIFKILSILIPLIRSLSVKIVEYRDEDSQGGKKITGDEWEAIIAHFLMQDLGPQLVDILRDANK